MLLKFAMNGESVSSKEYLTYEITWKLTPLAVITNSKNQLNLIPILLDIIIARSRWARRPDAASR